LFVLFLVPETKFFRSPTALNGEFLVVTDEFGTTHTLTNEEARARFGDVQEGSTVPVRKKSFLQNLMPFNKIEPGSLRVWVGVYGKILKCCTSPGVIFATLASSISLGEKIFVQMIEITNTLVLRDWNCYHAHLQYRTYRRLPLVPRIRRSFQREQDIFSIFGFILTAISTGWNHPGMFPCNVLQRLCRKQSQLLVSQAQWRRA
jgi:hypothetical protein